MIMDCYFILFFLLVYFEFLYLSMFVGGDDFWLYRVAAD